MLASLCMSSQLIISNIHFILVSIRMFLLIFRLLVFLSRLSFLLGRLGYVLFGFALLRGLFAILFVGLDVQNHLFRHQFHFFHFVIQSSLNSYEIGQHLFVILLILIVLVLFLFRIIFGLLKTSFFLFLLTHTYNLLFSLFVIRINLLAILFNREH